MPTDINELKKVINKKEKELQVIKKNGKLDKINKII
jgi:hypothetical protein